MQTETNGTINQEEPTHFGNSVIRQRISVNIESDRERGEAFTSSEALIEMP